MKIPKHLTHKPIIVVEDYFDGYLEGPISEDISFIFGVRKSYLEYILSMIDDKEISVAKPSFYDVQGVLAFQLSTGSKLLLEFLHSDKESISFFVVKIIIMKEENQYIFLSQHY